MLSKENALHYKQRNNEMFRRNASYRRSDVEQNPICSTRKMPIPIHRLKTKLFLYTPPIDYAKMHVNNALHSTQDNNETFGDMPLIAGEIWQKSSFALLEKCPLLYTEKERNVSRYALI